MGLQRLKDEADLLVNQSDELRIHAEIAEGEYRVFRQKRDRAWKLWQDAYGAAMGAVERVAEVEARLGKNES